MLLTASAKQEPMITYDLRIAQNHVRLQNVHGKLHARETESQTSMETTTTPFLLPFEWGLDSN